MRPVYKSALSYPRYVGDFYPGFAPEGDQVPMEPVGYIPETMEETYAYHNGLYGLMNEHMLSIGESTCAGMIWTEVAPEGKAMFEVGALTRVAMERCASSRCAVELMGELAEEYGFFGAETGSPEAGEALTVTDGEESWMFHILADTTGTSAIWAAVRVPDDHVAVCANAFVIRAIDFEDKENYLYSANIKSEAQKAGLWDEESSNGVFDFAVVFSPPLIQITNPINYSTRRQWRVFSIVAPEFAAANLDPDDRRFPFSVKVEKQLSVQDVMQINRDYFQGTPFDLSTGLGAGPFGTPVRYENSPTVAWERPISLHRTVYSTVLQSRKAVGAVSIDGVSAPPAAAGTALPPSVGGVAWLGFDTPHSSAYMPWFAGAQQMPESYKTGQLSKFDRASAFWAFQFIGNWVNLMFGPMIQDVRKAQGIAEAEAFKMVDRFTADALNWTPEDGCLLDALTAASNKYAAALIDAWWALGEHLIGKYNDGYVNDVVVGTDIGYPLWWVKAIGGQTMAEQKAAEIARAAGGDDLHGGAGSDSSEDDSSDDSADAGVAPAYRAAPSTPVVHRAQPAAGAEEEPAVQAEAVNAQHAVQLHGGAAAMLAVTLMVVGAGAGFVLAGRARGYTPISGRTDEERGLINGGLESSAGYYQSRQ